MNIVSASEILQRGREPLLNSWVYIFPPLSCASSVAAVQEERQRNREREGELEFTGGVNDEMPVEKILEAEMAVEQKTELHTDGGSAGNSVSGRNIAVSRFTVSHISRFLIYRR